MCTQVASKGYLLGKLNAYKFHKVPNSQKYIPTKYPFFFNLQEVLPAIISIFKVACMFHKSVNITVWNSL